MFTYMFTYMLGKRGVKLQKHKTRTGWQYKVTINTALVNAKGWNKGERLEWKITTNGDLMLLRAKNKE